MKDFMTGAATSAHQTEGGNIHSDMWAQEQMKHSSFKEPSLAACDHYNRYEQDIKLMADASLDAYRFSIEWARIEPEEGKFCEAALDHYARVLDACAACGITPVVTLHHFSSPAWLISKGGWENEATADYFARYCGYVVSRLGGRLKYVCTINEANMGLQVAALSKAAMAQLKGAAGTAGGIQVGVDIRKAMENSRYAEQENMEAFGTPRPATFLSGRTEAGDMVIIKAHMKAMEAIKSLCPSIKAGITLSLHDIQPAPGGEKEAARLWEEEFGHYVPYIKRDDFIGIQNYTRTVTGPDGALPPSGELTEMGYEIYPQSVGNVARRVYRETGIPVMITENGICISDDSIRCQYIHDAAESVKGCLADGIPVLGYFYWSLLDNFEWQQGFGKPFGLVAVDRQTMERKPKQSLYMLKSAFED